jgi:prepilin-type N-terminal cleavage/methylation domain-containing protein
MKHTHFRQGFSLIEVMIVLVIIGIMAAIAIPSYRAWFPRHQLRSAKKDVVEAMQLGKMRAIGSGHVFYLDFDPDNNGTVANTFTGYLDTDDDGADGEADNNSAALTELMQHEYEQSQMALPDVVGGVRVVRLPGNVTFGSGSGGTAAPNSDAIGDGVSVTNDRIEFRPNGRVTLNSGTNNWPTIYLRSSAGESFAIQINMVGSVRVRKWNGTAWQ